MKKKKKVKKWLGKGSGNINEFDSSFYDKKEGYNKELFEEDNNRINVVLFLESQRRLELLQKNRLLSTPLVFSSSSSSSTSPLVFSFSSSSV
jgi:hypothetical protein